MGCDTLFLLDEVHLSRPFAELLQQLADLRTQEATVTRRVAAVRLSATPGEARAGARRFGLSAEDEKALAKVLDASKPAVLETVPVRSRAAETAKRAALAAHAARRAREMIVEGRRAVLVVVNRVDTARRVWSEMGGSDEFERALVTGRMRPLDQEAVLDSVGKRVRAGRDNDPEARPLVLVSTQSIEAGADFDFDGLVTEGASLDALRQRFGRLDRRGEIEDRIGTKARAAILTRSDIDEDDPVYGGSMKRTWDWLQALPDVDFGISALRLHLDALPAKTLRGMIAPWREAAVLLPTYLEQLAQTSQLPQADPDISLFLHGVPSDGRATSTEVRVVWRADVTEGELARADASPDYLDALVERVAAVPPGSLEALSLPIWTVRRWLALDPEGDTSDELSDIEGAIASQVDAGASKKVLDWRGPGESKVVRPDRLRPGATIVVPASYGGIPEHGTFDPDASDFVEDLGDVTQDRQRGRPTLRIDERVWPASRQAGVSELRGDLSDETLSLPDRLRSLLRDARIEVPHDATEERFERLRGLVLPGHRVVQAVAWWQRDDEETGRERPVWVAVGRQRHGGSRDATDENGARVEAEFALAVTSEDDESFTEVAVPLEGHCRDVADAAAAYAESLGLPEWLQATLRWAGELHDIGKADPRFLAMLHGGDIVAARFSKPLAKSLVPAQDAKARSRARTLAGYPRGQRHEMVSLEMIERSQELREAVEAQGADWDLVLHLVASHHGWARPFAPVVSDQNVADNVEWTVGKIALSGTTAHRRERLDSGVSRRFFTMGRRYGWHEVAYLEAILRLADHRVSERETKG
jgi:CRISPR-associated endonuclease/helicase Cas3